MKREAIIAMARKAGSLIELAQEKDLQWLERFAALVAKAELARTDEPVAYAYKNEFGLTLSEHDRSGLPDGVSTPLYAAPQPVQPLKESNHG